MIKLILTGNTYGIRYEIKGKGFRWHPDFKAWYKFFNDADKADAEAIAKEYGRNGVQAKLEAIEGNVKEKRYPVKESYLFNLESMHDKIFCLMYDIRDGKIATPFVVAKKTINDEGDLWELLDEAETLRSKASHPVSGKDYGRIKEIVSWRVEQRYARCMASGMSEAEAGKCWEDM